MNTAKIGDVIGFLDRLKDARIHYALADHTSNAIMVLISVPGERWEVEFHSDGEVGVEVFRSDGHVSNGDLLDDLFGRFTD
jgi:hypothetical protein